MALVRIGAKLDHARSVLAARSESESKAVAARTAPASNEELAATHYQERLALDLALRRAGPTWASIGIDDLYVHQLRAILAGKLSDEQVKEAIGDILERYRLRGTLVAEPGTTELRAAAQVVAGAELAALERVYERDEGVDPARQVHPPHLIPPPTDHVVPPEPPDHLSLRGLLDSHLKALEKDGRGRAGRKAWPRVFDNLLEFLAERRGLRGTARRQADDAHRLTGVELAAWRDKVLETHSSKTVKDVWMASVKAVLQRAIENHQLTENPAAGVKVRSSPRVVGRPKGYTDTEAVAILRAAKDYRPVVGPNPRTNESAHVSAAKRWGPWLCAFTGARITEIMQLRRGDVRFEGGIHYLRLTPDAGQVKSRIFRDVPLHPQLIEDGFLQFVAGAKSEPLFYSTDADASKQPAQITSGRLSQWLRHAKLTPEGVQPNHAWRHRFKTVSRDLGLDPRVIEAIQGHAGRTAADGYGEVSLKAKYASIRQFPRIET